MGDGNVRFFAFLVDAAISSVRQCRDLRRLPSPVTAANTVARARVRICMRRMQSSVTLQIAVSNPCRFDMSAQ